MGNSDKDDGQAALSLPDISGATLANLTARIEKDLHKGKGPTPKQNTKTQKEASSKKTTKAAGASKDQHTSTAEKKTKKRNRSDDTTDEPDESQPKRRSAPKTKKARPAEKELSSELVHAMGGSDDDLELLKGVDSDSEMEGQDEYPADTDETSLRRDLVGLLKGIDPSYVVPELPAKKAGAKKVQKAGNASERQGKKGKSSQVAEQQTEKKKESSKGGKKQVERAEDDSKATQKETARPARNKGAKKAGEKEAPAVTQTTVKKSKKSKSVHDSVKKSD